MCSIADNVDKTMMVQGAAMNYLLQCTVEAIIKNSYTMYVLYYTGVYSEIEACSLPATKAVARVGNEMWQPTGPIRWHLALADSSANNCPSSLCPNGDPTASH